MKQARWRHGVVIVAVVAAIAIIFFIKAPARDAQSEGGEAIAGARSGEDLSSAPGAAPDARPPLPPRARNASGGNVPVAVPANLPSVDPVDPAGYDTGLPTDTLFAPLPQARDHFADKLPFGVDDRSYIEFNRSALRALEIGSVLTVRTPDDGQQHRIRIDEVQVHPNGDKSWFGRVLGGRGGVLPAVFTQGIDSSFGSFSTATGSYSLEADGRLGWIANINDLRRHQDFSTPDVLVPDPGDARRPPAGSAAGP